MLFFLLGPINIYGQDKKSVTIGSKLFTESVILGEISTQLIRAEGIPASYYDQLGGTRILWNSLVQGEIDAYPDYTGTIIQEILQDTSISTFTELESHIAEFGIKATLPLGFNNTYALGMRRSQAEKLGIKNISDLRDHSELSHGYSNEFIKRTDGWKGIRSTYNLNPNSVTGLDHDLAYRGLESGSIDVIDLYSTDAEIEYYELKVLEDDRNFFPEYQAIFLYRADLEERSSGAVRVLNRLAGKISEDQMVSMNAEVKLDGKDSQIVASNFIQDNFGVETEVTTNRLWQRLWKNTLGHLYLVGISLVLAIIIAIPTGILAVKVSSIEQTVLGVVGILQTIPSLALLVFMIPLFGIGALPAMAALFLYSLLPIVRNTHSGIKSIPQTTMESARALGLPNSVILKKIELPLAIPTILAGIKTSAVINVGTATLGALIGAGGYGQPILTGIRLDSISLILEGAIPAALLALLVQGFFDLVERKLT
ncbi:glycine betaine ABC transporter substrate-binding protein [Gracilimonas sp. Q87]|uniref:ABC transporter permease/substrate-binding protein n=1 Tax=Gracilimonas sp. Q87 TaxID=3384766 RepID=UPI00398438C2